MPDLATPDTLTITPVREPAELEALRPEWEALWQRSPEATPFQSPHWLLSWWRVYGDGELLSWALRDEGRLVALAPTYIYGAAPHRRLMFLGTGNSDRLDLLAEPGYGALAAAGIVDAAAREQGSWDACLLRRLPATSPLLAAPAGWQSGPEEPCPVLHLGENEERRGIGHAAEQQRRRSAARLSFELADADTFEALFAGLLRLHAARWAARGETGVLDAAPDRRFHREAAGKFLRAGMLRLHALRIDGEIAAVLYALHGHRRTFYYLGGFDPQHARVSPGTLIIAQAIRHARAEGDLAFDFLAGREAYKYRWGAVDDPVWQMHR